MNAIIENKAKGMEEIVGREYDSEKLLSALNEPDEEDTICFYDSPTAWFMGFAVNPFDGWLNPHLEQPEIENQANGMDTNPHLEVPEDV